MLVVKAVHTFVAEHSDELEFEAGEDIEVLEKDDAFGDGWWRGRNAKGEEGLFPATYIAQENNAAADTGKVTESVPEAIAPTASTDAATPGLTNGGTHTSEQHTSAVNGVAEKSDSEPQYGESVISPVGGTTSKALESPVAPAAASLPPVSPEIPAPESPRGGRGDALPMTAAPVAAAAALPKQPNGHGSDDEEEEEELGIGQDARARLAQQAKLANEHRELNRAGGGIEGLVYSDESDDEDDVRRRSARTSQGKKLEPALPLPATPVIGQSSNKPPAQWSVDEVVDWARSKAFDEGIAERFREHEITGDLLMELDANLLKELDIPALGKRLRIAQAINELKSSSQTPSLTSGPTMGSHLGPSYGAAVTPPIGSPNPEDPSWAGSRKTSSIKEPMQPIREGELSAPNTSIPPSPVTPSSAKRESTGSVGGAVLGHRKGKSVDNKERLSFFGRNRKPAPTTPSDGVRRTADNKTYQMQAATPQRSPIASLGSAAALKQIGTPDYSGFLKKRGDRYGSWKTRFFVLKGAHLYYMKSEHEDKVKGHIALAGHRVIVDANANPGSYGFRLVGPDKPHYFSSSEQSAVRGWMKALMKATIARDYTVAVTSSCNIPTIPLAEAQALRPRPPSPATREATQRASRRENTNTLTAHDANILMSLDTTSGQARRASQQIPPSASPNRPSRRVSDSTQRTVSNQQSAAAAAAAAAARAADSASPSSAAMRSTASQGSTGSKGPDHPLVQWVNNLLPAQYPRATSLPASFISGEVIFLLVRALSGIEPSPPVPPTAFSPEPDGQPGVEGLFAMMDILIDSGVDTAGVSLNEIRSGDVPAISRLLESIRLWNDQRDK